MNILALDIGTTSMRGILFDGDGTMLAESTAKTQPLIDPARGRMEQNPKVYEAGLLAICSAIAAGNRVDAVSLTAFRSAPTLVDASGEALCNFIMWQDTRNCALCKRLEYANERVLKTCGASINTVFTAGKIAWLKQNEPALYRRAYRAMIVPDYLLCRMTGVFKTDYTYGSRASLMDIRDLQWSGAMCDLFGVDGDKLCELIPQGSVAGQVTEAFSRLTGIPSGVPVVSAGGDQQCGALGLGVLDETTIEVNSGTGSFVISLSDAPYLENPSVICNVASIPGKYVLEMNVISSASALDWLAREYFPECVPNGQVDYAALNRLAEASPPGAGGLCALPHFQGCGSRDWNPQARAGFWGFSLGSHRRDMIRALYEGIACEIAKSIEALPPACRAARAIAVAGGLSKSDIYNRVLCDVTGRDLIKGENPQATAVGAFVSAAVALGLYKDYAAALEAARRGENPTVLRPNPELFGLYQSIQEKTERLYQAARGFNPCEPSAT